MKKPRNKFVLTVLLCLLGVLALASTHDETYFGAASAPLVESKPQSRAMNMSIPPQLKRIAECESGDRHYDLKGRVIRGTQNSYDVGRYQINTLYHGEVAKAMGLDLLNEQDNETYALYLYGKESGKPWAWSKKCWGKSL